MKKFLLLLLLSSSLHAQVPGVSAKSYIVTDVTGKIILEFNSQTPRPIASITKLLVAEQIAPSMVGTELVTVNAVDHATKWSRLKVNTVVSENDLLHLALIPSNNQAIYALSRAHDMSKIVSAVNDTARNRGLLSITIEEPSGLSPNNKANAKDLAQFLQFVNGTEIARVSTEPFAYTNFRSTNPLLGKPGWDFSISKTGFINASGGCLATMVNMGGEQRIVVILGSQNTKTRWTDLIKIRSFIAASDKFWQMNSSNRRHK